MQHSDAPFPRTITHDKGQMEIPEQPERIAALDNSLVEAVVLLDRPLVGGISSHRDQTGFPDYLGDAVATPRTSAAGAAGSRGGRGAGTGRHRLGHRPPRRPLRRAVENRPDRFRQTTGPQWRENITFLGEVFEVDPARW